MLTLIIYRHGSDDPEIRTFKTRQEYTEAARTMRRTIRRQRRRRERPIYGTPILAVNTGSTSVPSQQRTTGDPRLG